MELRYVQIINHVLLRLRNKLIFESLLRGVEDNIASDGFVVRAKLKTIVRQE